MGFQSFVENSCLLHPNNKPMRALTIKLRFGQLNNKLKQAIKFCRTEGNKKNLVIILVSSSQQVNPSTSISHLVH